MASWRDGKLAHQGLWWSEVDLWRDISTTTLDCERCDCRMRYQAAPPSVLLYDQLQIPVPIPIPNFSFRVEWCPIARITSLAMDSSTEVTAWELHHSWWRGTFLTWQLVEIVYNIANFVSFPLPLKALFSFFSFVFPLSGVLRQGCQSHMVMLLRLLSSQEAACSNWH